RPRAARRTRLQRSRRRHGNRDGTTVGTARARCAGHGTRLPGLTRSARAAPFPERTRSALRDPISAPRGRALAGWRTSARSQQRIGMSTSIMKIGVLVALALINIAFAIGWLRAIRRHHLGGRPGLTDIAIGSITTFFDALGIGSFATTTALFKVRGRPADELI